MFQIERGMKILYLNNLTHITDGLMDIEHGKDCSYSVKSSCTEENIPKNISEVMSSAARNSIKLLSRLMSSLVL